VSATTVKLVQAAMEIAGGRRALALRLGVEESLLAKFLTDWYPVPDPLLLKALDIILEERRTRTSVDPAATGISPQVPT
jgi:hypothetical protein